MERYREKGGSFSLECVVSELWIISLLTAHSFFFSFFFFLFERVLTAHSNPETFFLILNLSFFSMISILVCFVSPLF